MQERKQLLRYLIAEMRLDGIGNPGKIDIRVTWRSGAVSHRQIDRVRVAAWAPRTDDRVIVRIRVLAPRHIVVEILKQDGQRSAHGHECRDHHVLYLERRYSIAVSISARLLGRSAH